MDIYLSELRITEDEEEILKTESIRPGTKTICHASMQLLLERGQNTVITAKGKLDSCGSVSIAHSNLLNTIKPARDYKLPNIRLRGIGGRTNMLSKIGVLKIKRPSNESCELLCYVFNEVVGQTEEMLLISLSAIIDAKINILYHMNESNKNECHALKFWPNNKTFEEVCKDVTVDEEINQVFRAEARINPRDLYLSSDNFVEVEKHQLVNLLINHIETGTTVLEEAYMTEIQLRRVLDRNGSNMGDQQSDIWG
jgi:hypothetical protein